MLRRACYARLEIACRSRQDFQKFLLFHERITMKTETASELSTKPQIDPALVPQRVLYSGARMPAIGLGTFGSDHASADDVAAAVEDAVVVGYRHFDCASVYGNEPEIVHALEHIAAGGVKREQLWITSKLWIDRHGEKDVIPSCRQSLADLRLDYLDLYLVHWPFPNFHPPGCDVTSRSKDAKPYVHADFMKTWRKMEELVDLGLVRHIGTSNMTIPKLKFVLRDARIKPAVNQMELHPHFQQPELFEFVRSNGIGTCPRWTAHFTHTTAGCTPSRFAILMITGSSVGAVSSEVRSCSGRPGEPIGQYPTGTIPFDRTNSNSSGC